MASSLGALDMWCKAVVDSEPWRWADPDCPPIPWRPIQLPQKLCFGMSSACPQRISVDA